MVTGRLFHNDGPATEKARRPYRSRLYRGIVTDHDKPLSTALVVDIELTALTSHIVRAACRRLQTTAKTASPDSSKLVFYTTHAFYVYILYTKLNYYLYFYLHVVVFRMCFLVQLLYTAMLISSDIWRSQFELQRNYLI